MSSFCRLPWENLVLNKTCYAPCCYTLKPEAYTFSEKTIQDLMKSRYLSEYRQSVLNGTYEYCAPFCPKLPTFSREKMQIADLEVKLKVLGLNYDESCNLTCPSCRDHFKKDESNSFYENLFAQAFQTEKLEELYLSGSGEALVSSNHRSWLMNFNRKSYPHLKSLALASNGQLLDEEMWKSFPDDLKALDLVYIISVDAATEATYQKIRRGGDFSRLLNNLDFASRLLEEKKIKGLLCNFIIQKDNYKEIADFLVMTQKRWNVTNVSFVEILPWGGTESGYFETQAIWEKNHPEHRDYLKVISNPHFYGFEYQGIHRDQWGRGFHWEFKQEESLPTGLNMFKLSVQTQYLSFKQRVHLKSNYPLLQLDDLNAPYQLILHPSFFERGMNLIKVLNENSAYWAQETYFPKMGYKLLQKIVGKDQVSGVWFSSLEELNDLSHDEYYLQKESQDKAQFTFLITENNYHELFSVVRFASLEMKLRSLHIYERKTIDSEEYRFMIQSPFLLGVHYYGPSKELWGSPRKFVSEGQSPSFYYSLFKVVVEDDLLTEEQKMILLKDYPQLIFKSSLENEGKLDGIRYLIRLWPLFFEADKALSLWSLLFNFISQRGQHYRANRNLGYEIGEAF